MSKFKFKTIADLAAQLNAAFLRGPKQRGGIIMSKFKFKTVADLVAQLNAEGIPLDEAKFELAYHHATYTESNETVPAHDSLWFVGVIAGWGSDVLVELEGFKLMQIHWSDLQIFDTDNIDIPAHSEEWFAKLERYRVTGDAEGFFFRPVGFPFEEEDDASTWGPSSPENVDWTGFQK